MVTGDDRRERLLQRAPLGVFSREEARAAGFTKSSMQWMVARGLWERLHPRVFRVGAGPLSWQQRAAAALLSAGAGCALSHRSAAYLWRLEGFAERPPELIDVAVPPGRRVKSALEKVVLHRVGRPFLSTRAQGLRVTGVARTFIDLAAVADPSTLEFALDTAHQRFAELRDWLASELDDSRRGVAGAALVRQLIEARGEAPGGPAGSPLEVVVRTALRRSGLPAPVGQFEIFDGDTYVMRVDLAWPRHRVALHVDSYSWHLQRERLDLDGWQRSRLAALGQHSVIVTAESLRSEEWLRTLRRVLERTRPSGNLATFGPS